MSVYLIPYEVESIDEEYERFTFLVKDQPNLQITISRKADKALFIELMDCLRDGLRIEMNKIVNWMTDNPTLRSADNDAGTSVKTDNLASEIHSEGGLKANNHATTFRKGKTRGQPCNVGETPTPHTSYCDCGGSPHEKWCKEFKKQGVKP